MELWWGLLDFGNGYDASSNHGVIYSMAYSILLQFVESPYILFYFKVEPVRFRNILWNGLFETLACTAVMKHSEKIWLYKKKKKKKKDLRNKWCVVTKRSHDNIDVQLQPDQCWWGIFMSFQMFSIFILVGKRLTLFKYL